MSGKWTEDEDRVLRDFWLKPGFIAAYMHLLPGRSQQSIEKRGQHLSLGPRKLWKAEQDNLLREIWLSGGRIKSHIDQFPGHTLAAINSRAHNLGLGKRPKRGWIGDTSSWQVIKHELQRGDSICDRLCDASGLHRSTVYEIIGTRHKAGEVHIVRWDRRSTGGRPIPIYRLGKGVDAPKPEPLRGVRKEKKYRQADLHRRVLAGETVKTINPFAAAAGLVTIPEGQRGRVFQQSMKLSDFDEELAA